MRKVSYILLTFAVSVFFVVLTVIQSMYVKNIIQMKKIIFTRTVNDVMSDVLTEIYTKYSEEVKFPNQDIYIEKEEPINAFQVVGNEIREYEIKQYIKNKYPNLVSGTSINKTETTENNHPVTKLKHDFLKNESHFTVSDIYYMDSVIQSALSSFQLEENFEFGIYCPYYKKYIISSNYSMLEEMSMKGYVYKCMINHSSMLYPSYFVIYFPLQNRFLSFKSNMLIAISSMMIIIIYGLFLFTVITTIESRKIQKSRDDFVDNMTHEFKTPIATVSLASEALKDKEIIGNIILRENYLKIISMENKRLEHMVETILSNATSNKRLRSKLNLEIVDINILVEQAINLIKVILEQKGGRIICLKAKDPLIYIDKEKMIIAIKNLLDNAIKYTRLKPVIRIEITNKKNKILISVSDNGIGIQRNYYNKIFERLFRISTGNIHDVKGYGLGLNYVKAIIRLHGGRITVESEINKGSTFRIYLPIKQDAWKQKEKF